MCGITAIAGEKMNIKRYDTAAMLLALSHRGPDGGEEKLFSSCWLGHRRLAIIDLEKGKQPMFDEELSISFNGEIYNYLTLRAQLEKNGYQFKTQSDTEVILKSYRMWGSECPKHLDGMFAFIIWDNENEELFIARDRLGKKPLYYFFDGASIIVSSEIKSLIASNKLTPQLDLKAIDNYLRLMYIPPWKSVYENVYQVPPAHCGIFKKGKISLQRYWQLIYSPLDITYEEAKEEVRRLLIEAVRKRLLSTDVEVGVFLSGGLDSSLVALIASKELNYPLKVFSVSYGGHDELPFAKQVCKKIRGEHFVVKIDECLTDELDAVIAYFDEPHADTSDFPQHMLSNLASQKVKLVLSGDGADELFLGYKWHNKENIFPSDFDYFERRLYSICAFQSQSREKIWQSPDITNNDVLAKNVYLNLPDSMDRVVMFDLTSHLPGQILTKVDRAGMMHGLEVRSPFLDTDLVEFVFNLPYEYKVRKGEQKGIIKDILTEYMPRDFAYRQKQGFGAPIERWLSASRMKDYVYKKLGSTHIRSILSGKSIDAYLYDFYCNEHKDARAAQRVWVLLCLERWLANSNLFYEK